MRQTERVQCQCAGSCCRSCIVNVCGYDVWRLAASQRLRPEQFVVVFPHEELAGDSFLLGVDLPPVGLALDKRGRGREGQFRASNPCIFLVRLQDGTERCGTYSHRPLACQAYPMSIWGGEVYQRGDVLCPAGAWQLDGEHQAPWLEMFQRVRMHFDIYAEVVARWNARVLLAGNGARFDAHEYFSYLMNVYDRLERHTMSVGPDAIETVISTWPGLPRPAADFDLTTHVDAAPPWLAYLRAAREVIDGFYPDIPPQPFPAFWSGRVGEPQGAPSTPDG